MHFLNFAKMFTYFNQNKMKYFIITIWLWCNKFINSVCVAFGLIDVDSNSQFYIFYSTNVMKTWKRILMISLLSRKMVKMVIKYNGWSRNKKKFKSIFFPSQK